MQTLQLQLTGPWQHQAVPGASSTGCTSLPPASHNSSPSPSPLCPCRHEGARVCEAKPRSGPAPALCAPWPISCPRRSLSWFHTDKVKPDPTLSISGHRNTTDRQWGWAPAALPRPSLVQHPLGLAMAEAAVYSLCFPHFPVHLCSAKPEPQQTRMGSALRLGAVAFQRAAG